MAEFRAPAYVGTITETVVDAVITLTGKDESASPDFPQNPLLLWESSKTV